jgi:hypothetical protein
MPEILSAIDITLRSHPLQPWAKQLFNACANHIQMLAAGSWLNDLRCLCVAESLQPLGGIRTDSALRV